MNKDFLTPERIAEGWVKHTYPDYRRKLKPDDLVEVAYVFGPSSELRRLHHAHQVDWSRVTYYRILKPVVRVKAESISSPAPLPVGWKVGDWVKRRNYESRHFEVGKLYKIAEITSHQDWFRIEGFPPSAHFFAPFGSRPTPEEIAEAERLEALRSLPSEHHPFHHMTLTA